ncbi:MAG: hypothetical protein QM703_16030 [Gemmatales bacterium]
MQPETRARSLTHVESLFAPEVPVEERQKSLVNIHQQDRPDADAVAAVVSLLNDPDDSIRQMAEQVLCGWGQPAVTKILHALRSTDVTDVPMRLALLGQLKRMGPMAARAETLLRSLMSDKDIGEAAGQALRAIRRDGDDLTRRLMHWGGELALLSAVVAAPMIAIRVAAKNQPMPPLGMSVGIASLVIVGLMMARVVYADDLIEGKASDELAGRGRWSIYAVMAVGGALVGAALGGLCLACGGWAQQLFK